MALQLREVRVWEVVGVVAEIRSWWNYRIGNFTFSRVNSSVCGGWGGGDFVCGACLWMGMSVDAEFAGGLRGGWNRAGGARARPRPRPSTGASLARTHALTAFVRWY